MLFLWSSRYTEPKTKFLTETIKCIVMYNVKQYFMWLWCTVYELADFAITSDSWMSLLILSFLDFAHFCGWGQLLCVHILHYNCYTCTLCAYSVSAAQQHIYREFKISPEPLGVPFMPINRERKQLWDTGAECIWQCNRLQMVAIGWLVWSTVVLCDGKACHNPTGLDCFVCLRWHL